jgi:hypothetical protein
LHDWRRYHFRKHLRVDLGGGEDNRDAGELGVVAHDGKQAVGATPRQSPIKDQEVRSALPQMVQALQTAPGRLDLPPVIGKEPSIEVAQVRVRVGDENGRRHGHFLSTDWQSFEAPVACLLALDHAPFQY